MNTSRHKSGAQKRKIKEEKDKKSKKGQKSLESCIKFMKPSDANNNKEKVNLQDDNDQKGNQNVDNITIRTLNRESTSKEQIIGQFEEEKQDESEHEGSDIDASEPEPLKPYDVGSIKQRLSNDELKSAVARGPPPNPAILPQDNTGRKFPKKIWKRSLKNNESVTRDWLVWSQYRQALYCFPCRLFIDEIGNISENQIGHFISSSGWTADIGWSNLYRSVQPHEDSKHHKECYLRWRQEEEQLRIGVDKPFYHQIKSKVQLWKDILRRLLDVTLFLGERGLAFRGSSNKLGDPDNGNFLGILELLANYDPVLKQHLDNVREAQHVRELQKSKGRLQVSYLSVETQNEFIILCGQLVKDKILQELKESKYFAIIVDSTPDTSHTEQTTIILRMVVFDGNKFVIKERFLQFSDCSQKTGEAITALILEVLSKHDIPISLCRGQGYDNCANMKGLYGGVQALILKENPLAKFSPCACHSLNLCGVHAAESCTEAKLFFGFIQGLYNEFSCSPQRWEILKNIVGSSLHSMSQTRWSARLESVRPVFVHFPKIIVALEDLKKLNLTSESLSRINGILAYMKTFKCLLLTHIWFKLLTPIDQVNRVLQARKSTIDWEVKNLNSLTDQITEIKDQWQEILDNAKSSAVIYEIEPTLLVKRTRKVKHFHDESPDEPVIGTPEELFKINTFNVIVDRVQTELSKRYGEVKELNESFCFLWNYIDMSVDEIKKSAASFIAEYSVDVSNDLTEEVLFLKNIHVANFGNEKLRPIKLLNRLYESKLSSMFPNCCIALRLFCTLPVTVAEGERSFSTLDRVKNCKRSTMKQDRLSALSILSIESELARKLDYNDMIESFAQKKARRALIY